MKNFIKTGITVNNTHLNWLIAILLCANVSTSSLGNANSKTRTAKRIVAMTANTCIQTEKQLLASKMCAAKSMDKLELGKLIDSLSILQHIQFIKYLHKNSNCDDLSNAVQLLVHKFSNKDNQKNIEAFLKEVKSLPKNVDAAVKEELLRVTPEFYESFVAQKDKLISEEQLNENIVIKEYWNGNVGDVNLYDVKLFNIKTKKIIKTFRAYKVLRLNNHTIAIKYFKTIELYDFEKKETIKKFQGTREILPLNNHTVVIKYRDNDTTELYDFETKKTIKKFQNVREVVPLNDHIVAIRYRGVVELYDLETKKTIKKFQKVWNVLRLNDHTVVAIKYLDNDTTELYDLETKKTIKKFQKVRNVLRLNDHTIAIEYWGNDTTELYDLEIKKIVWKKKIGLLSKIKFLGKELAVINRYATVKVFNWRKDKLIFEESAHNPFDTSIIEIRGNNIWKKEYNRRNDFMLHDNWSSRMIINDWRPTRLKRFGPDLSLKKLNTKQLLLFILAMRKKQPPQKINSVVWESIDSELQEKLLDIYNAKT